MCIYARLYVCVHAHACVSAFVCVRARAYVLMHMTDSKHIGGQLHDTIEGYVFNNV